MACNEWDCSELAAQLCTFFLTSAIDGEKVFKMGFSLSVPGTTVRLFILCLLSMAYAEGPLSHLVTHGQIHRGKKSQS